MSLEHTRRTYEEFGREDPLYAVLTTPEFRHGANEARFFETGREEIARVLARVDVLAPGLARASALDFGCGVGRLTQALADHFGEAVGVDIASSMVERARACNRHGDRVRYVVNTVDDLRVFPSDSFDFVYSNISLQHSPPDAGKRYIAEFLRLLRPGGVAAFQVPNGPPIPATGLGAWWYRLRRQHVRRLWKRLRGKVAYEMHHIPRGEVEAILAAGGATLLAADPVGHRPGRNFMYFAQRPAAGS